MNSVFIPYSNIFILAIPLFPSAILSANHPWMNSKHTTLPTSVTAWMSCGCTIHYPVCTRPPPKSFACVCLCVWVCVWVRRCITETSKFFIHLTTENETLKKFRPTPTPNYRRLAGPTHARLVISFPTLRVKISFHTHDMQQEGSLCG